MKLRPLIPEKFEQVTVRFPVDLYAHVLAYKDVLGEATDRNYVIVEAVRAFLAGNKEFQKLVAQSRTGRERSRRQQTASETVKAPS
jgi:hypothetical protein